MARGQDFLTDESIEEEISRLRNSPYVKLARKEERIRYRRRQYLYTLRLYDKKGRQLAADGITMESLDGLDAETDQEGISENALPDETGAKFLKD